jgi:DNA-binding transcriptional LysR family regulator
MMDAAKRLGKDNSEMLQATHIEMIKKWIQLGIGWSILPASLITKSDEKKFLVKSNTSLKSIEICAAMLEGERSSLLSNL